MNVGSDDPVLGIVGFVFRIVEPTAVISNMRLVGQFDIESTIGRRII